MSILNVFLSGAQLMKRGQFASIVRIAKSNGKLNRSELKLLRIIKKELDINELAYRRILRNPDLYPMNPPSSLDDRIEQLHMLCKMLLADEESKDISTKLLYGLAVGLGFTLDKHKLIVDKAIALVETNTDFDTFEAEIKKVKAIK